MKKTVLICGLIAGLISSSWFLGIMILGKAGHEDMKSGLIYGYSLMILAFSLIFVGTRITRDRYNGGAISLGRAFLIGLTITLIASTIYVGIWLIEYYGFIPDFMDKYAAHVVEDLRASGANQQEIARTSAKMATLIQQYKNPIYVIMLTYMEILPVGLIVSFISALALKRKKKHETSAAAFS
jgi:uncharacterized protein DUF4199